MKFVNKVVLALNKDWLTDSYRHVGKKEKRTTEKKRKPTLCVKDKCLANTSKSEPLLLYLCTDGAS